MTMYKPFSKPLFNVFLAAGFLLASCEERGLAPEVNQINTGAARLDVTKQVKEVNSNFDEIAVVLAKAMEEEQVREAIKAEASKQFDGDYDILCKDFVGAVLAGGDKFKDKLIGAHSVVKKTTASASRERIETILTQLPTLNIGVPVNIEMWDTKSFVPLVAVRPVDYDEKTATTIKAYDSKGAVHLLDAKTAPSFPVVVVALNERVDEEGRLRNWNTPKERPKSGRIAADTFGPWNRDAINYPRYPETLQSAGFKGMSALRQFEHWSAGRVELQLDIVRVDNTTSDKHPFTGRQEDWDSERYLDTGIFTWDYNTAGDQVKYHWTELDDAGPFKSIKVSVAATVKGVTLSRTVELTLDDNDDIIGERTVYFTDGIPGGYDIGNVFRFTTVQY